MVAPASLKLQPSPVQGPEAPKTPAPGRPPRAWLVAVSILALAVVAAIAFYALRGNKGTPAATGPAVSYVAATRGGLVRSIRIGGTVAAVHYAGITAPQMRGERGPGGPGGQMTIVKIIEAGKRVKKGDVLAEFDRQNQQSSYDQHEDQFIALNDQMASQRAQIQIAKEGRISDLQRAVADAEAARLEVKRNEVISRIDAEKNQQVLLEAEANLRMLRETQRLRDESDAAQLKLLDIQRERERLGMEHMKLNLDRMTVLSPIDGLVVLPPINRGTQQGPAQEGDTVFGGAPFIQVVDSSEMIVRARVNQLDAALLHPGAPVTIHLDAYPNVSLPGKVQNIAALAQNVGVTGKVKGFYVTFTVDGSDPRLFPDISANVDILLEQAPAALLVPRGAVVAQAGSRDAGFVWVKKDDHVQPRSVTLGPRNDTHWAILSGLNEGELVASVPPADALNSIGHQANPEKPAASSGKAGEAEQSKPTARTRPGPTVQGSKGSRVERFAALGRDRRLHV